MISLKNISKSYGEKIVLQDLNLDIESGKVLCVLGESGSGKTTLLNILAGLTDYSGVVTGVQKPLAMVFQKDRLIPNLTVLENLKLVNKSATKEDLERVGLAGTENLYPKSLSAGMSRRVSILRAMLFESSLLMLDEPFINLDIAIKYSIIDSIKKDRESDGEKQTVIMVTHDIKEAVTLADRIVVLAKGNIIKDIGNITADTEKELFDLFLSQKE